VHGNGRRLVEGPGRTPRFFPDQSGGPLWQSPLNRCVCIPHRNTDKQPSLLLIKSKARSSACAAGGNKFEVKVQRVGKGSTTAAVKGKVEVRAVLPVGPSVLP